MHITKEQLETVRHGAALRINEEGTDLVLMRADVFERLREASIDTSPWADEEMDLLAAEDADSLGWEGMEAYQDNKQ
jgi:hypothetical protein